MTPPGGPSLVTSPAMMLVGLGRIAERGIEDALAERDVTLRHIGVLGHLDRDPGLSISELARRGRITVQSMHVIVGALEERGLLRRRNAGAGRAADLRVTPKGRRTLDWAASVADDVGRRLLAGVPPDQRAAVSDAARAIVMSLGPGTR